MAKRKLPVVPPEDVLEETPAISSTPAKRLILLNRRQEQTKDTPGKPDSASVPQTTTKPIIGLAAKLASSRQSQAPHICLSALAGTGKSTSCVEGLKFARGLPTRIQPSDQQQAFWEVLRKGKGDSVRVSSFNTTITDEMKHKLAEAGLDKLGCEARGIHSLGNSALYKAFGRLEPTNYCVMDYTAEALGGDYRDIKKNPGVITIVNAVSELVDLCKQNLCEPTEEVLDQLASHYDVEVRDERKSYRDQIYQLVPEILERCKTPTGRIAFTDMIWLPLVLDLPIPKVDLQLVDEVQDLNRAQQELMYRAGHRLGIVGDIHQSVYGFSGADAESMRRMMTTLSSTPNGLVELPLTVTRRCGKAIVAEAAKLVPGFEAHESNCEGMVGEAVYPIQGKGQNRKVLSWEHTYCPLVEDGAMIICRLNAPLVSECFRFLKKGIKANILGRSVGKGLISLLEKSKCSDIKMLAVWLEDWRTQQVEIESKKKFPSETKIMQVQDRVDCLNCFAEGCSNISEVIRKVNNVFTDDGNSKGIRLSSIHKSKGLEAPQVFFLMPEGAECPHPMAKQSWQRQQELNLRYVGITRAISELYFVK